MRRQHRQQYTYPIILADGSPTGTSVQASSPMAARRKVAALYGVSLRGVCVHFTASAIELWLGRAARPCP